MSFARCVVAAGLFCAAVFMTCSPVRAEVIEEIVAWVNGDIITKTELEGEEQAQIAAAYREYTGDDLDRNVERIRAGILTEMIDRKILYHYAARKYQVDRMKDSYFEMFKQQQQIESDEELTRLLANEGLSVETFKDRLIEMLAPDDVVRIEVSSKIAVVDHEIDAYYNGHPDEFQTETEITLREIVILADTSAKKDARRAEAEAIRERVLTEDFAEVAQQVSDAGTKDEGGLLGTYRKGDLAEQIEEVAFLLPAGGVSDVIETDYGFHILKTDNRDDATLIPLDEIRPQLRQMLEQKKYIAELQRFLEKARAQADWCIKPAYYERAGDLSGAQTCGRL